ncbi:MAG: hypothetical protein GY850_06460 [bacterium]|nr:hypothetical protein [bacterium]
MAAYRLEHYGPKKISIKNQDFSGKLKKSGGQSFIDARTKCEQYKAAERKLNFEIKEGLWIKKTDAFNLTFRAARNARDAMLNMPARVAAIIAAEPDEKKCRKIIYKEMKQIIDEFCRKLESI